MSASRPAITLWGVSHRTAPIEVREQLAISEQHLPDTLNALKHPGHTPEVVCLSTCNRTEIYAVTAEPDTAVINAKKLFQTHFPKLRWGEHVYQCKDEDAVRHVFRVASSLDSMVLGEPQILGQVKRAFVLAQTHGFTGTLLARCFSAALGVGKQVRQRTELGRGHVSVSTIAVELVQRVFGDLSHLTVGLVGAGDMAEAALESLRMRARDISITNRTQENAERLVQRYHGVKVESWDRREQLMQDADVLILSTSSDKPLLDSATVKRVLKGRRYRPWCLLDLSLPRNVHPDVTKIDGVFVYNVDDLQHIAAENQSQRIEAAKEAERIVEHETALFMAWWNSLSVTDMIKHLRSRTQAIVEGVIATHPMTRQMTEDARSELVHTLAAKLLHQPLTELKSAASEADARALVSALERLFAQGPEK